MTLHPRTILLVEEEPILREITAFRLELLGYQVAACGLVREADKWLHNQLPAVIVLGFTADTHSLEFLNRLSNDPRTSDIPTVYLSASSDLEDVQRAYNAGADAFLVTPYDPQVLETKVHELLSNRSLTLAER